MAAPDTQILKYLKDLVSYCPISGQFSRKYTKTPISLKTQTAGGSKYKTLRIPKRICGVEKYISAPRIAWFFVTGEWPSAQIHVKNGDRADLRFENLQEGPPPPSTPTSGYLFEIQRVTIYSVFHGIRTEGKTKHTKLADFVTKEEALRFIEDYKKQRAVA